MFRLFIIILFAVAGSTGGIWGGLYFAGQRTVAIPERGDSAKVKTEFLTPELFVVPVVTRNEVLGFLVCRLAFAINPTLKPVDGIGEEVLMNDLFYDVVFKGNSYFPGENLAPDLSSAADMILAKLNVASGNGRFTNVYIQQVDFFSRDEVRRKVVEDRFARDG